MAQSPYDEHFFDNQERQSGGESTMLSVLFQWLSPRSVVDVGCGIGAWVRAAMDLGVADAVGIDGEYISRSRLKIPRDAFRAHDLAQPLVLSRRFDLALCLEVAEHLPQERGESFIIDLCNLSDVIVFSAAIPHQGGTAHLNEQWQSYWSSIFSVNGYEAFDLLRPRLWRDARVAAYYRQNCLVYATGDSARRLSTVPPSSILDCVHPDYWSGTTMTLRDMARLAPGALWKSLRYRAKREA